MTEIADLIGSGDVAAMLGLASYRAVTTLRARHPDFPPPAIDQPRGKLWRRSDIDRWGRETGRIR